MARNKLWSKVIEESGVRVRIFERERGGPLYRSVVNGKRLNGTGKLVSKKDIKSLGHHDRALAERDARALARSLAELQLRGLTPGSVTLGQLFRLYQTYQAPTLSPERQQWASSRIPMYLKAWGVDLHVGDISQTHVDRYCTQRRAGTLSPLSGTDQKGRRPVKVRDGTLDGDFRWLSSCFNWACGFKQGGRRLLSENPLHDVEWPRERRPRQPVASHDRYTRTQEHTDAVDPSGRLRCILALARFTGRRESAICGLSVTDVLLTEQSVRNALAAAGLNEQTRDPDTGEQLYPFGAIHWSAELDKQRLLHITPLDENARAELDRYLSANLRIGDTPLFPAPGNATAPMRRDTAAKWLVRAERLAKLPKLSGGAFHPYRRLWASERQHISDIAVASAGGWSDLRALKASYQKASALDVLRAVRKNA